jgi:tRNA A-37 threonylcarbamoyl transferase component Bud32
VAIPEKLGKYEIRRELGHGAMGVVYEGYDPSIERRVALKTIRRDQLERAEAEELISRFRREAQAAGRLTHANIVGIYEFGEDAGTAFIAMEFVEGRELKDYFDANERFSMADIGRIMGELLDALDYSHRQGVVHRDIKPANIILLKGGTVKVADFGIARIDSSTLTQAGSVLGTPSYMSPEQFMGQTVDGRSDIFSAGIVLYQFLTGERPFTGAFTTIMHKVLMQEPPMPSQLNVQVPPMFDAVITKALAKRPDERYQTASEFAQAIRAVIASPAGAAAGEATLLDARAMAKTVVNPGFANSTAMSAAASMVPGSPPSAPVGLAPAPGGATPGASPTPSTKAKSSPPMLVPILAGAAVLVVLIGGGGWYYLSGGTMGARGPGALAGAGVAAPAAPAVSGATAPTPPAPPSIVSENGTVVISAVGLADPADPRYKDSPATLQQGARDDARRQLIEKAAGLYVQQASLDQNYGVVRDKLLSRSGEFIKTVLDEQAPTLGKDGLMSASLKATVNVRAVQKSLNQMSTDERVNFIRNNGDPTISVAIYEHGADASPDAPPTRSPTAENLIKERIRSFGFRVFSDEAAAKQADFTIQGEVRFKKLSAKLAASGLTIEKFVITAWTVKALDQKTGEDIYYNTQIPEKRSWNSEELALADVGQLIGEEFNKTFFLQYFQFPVQQTRLNLSGVPAGAHPALLTEIAALAPVLSATLARGEGATMLVDATLSGTAGSSGEMVQGDILVPLNRKFGRNCLTVTAATPSEVKIGFDPGCAEAATLDRLQTEPPAVLYSAPAMRRDDVVKNPDILRRFNT